MRVGEQLRRARQAQNLSLQQVARKADLSSATLSRIETGKQSLDIDVFLQLAGILDLNPAELVAHNGNGKTRSLAETYGNLTVRDRVRLWRDLTTVGRTRKVSSRYTRSQIRAMAAEIELLLVQVKFMLEEINYLRRRLRNC